MDDHGDIFTAGGFSGDLTLGEITLRNPSGQDAFVAKLQGTSGSPLWTSHLGSTYSVNLQQITRNTSGSLFMTGTCGRATSFFLGTFNGTFQIPGAPPVTTAGCSDMILGKIPASR